MKRFILMLQSNFNGILKLEIRLNKLNELEFVYELWKINGNLPNSIVYSLRNNPLSEQVFNSIANKELMISNKLLLGEAQRLYTEIVKKLEEEKAKLKNVDIDNHYVCVQFPLLKTYLTYEQLLGLSGFLNQYISSYDIIKLNLINNATPIIKQEDKLEATKKEETELENKNLEDTNILQLLDLEDKKPIEVEDIETTIGRKILKDILSIAKDNSMLVLYVCKLIHNDLETGIYSTKLEDLISYQKDDENEKILFKFDPLISNNAIFSKCHSEELISVIETLNNYSKGELLGKLYLLVKYLKYLIDKYILPFYNNDEVDLSEYDIINHLIIPLKTIQFLIFITSFKYSSRLNYTHIKPEKIGDLINFLTNKSIVHVGKKYGLIFDQIIEFVNPKKPFKGTYEYPDCLFEAFEKYEYLLTVDKDAFITYVFNEVSLNLTSIEQDDSKTTCACSIDQVLINLPLNSKKIINIHDILEQNKSISLEKLPKTYIAYKDLKSDPVFYKQYEPILSQSIYKDNFIITAEYFEILRLLNLPSSSLITEDSFLKLEENFNPIILRYADVITNSIYHDLTLDDFYKTPVSVLYLLNQYILPNMPNNNFTIDILLFILYRTVIPYIVDMFKVSEIVDYFH